MSDLRDAIAAAIARGLMEHGIAPKGTQWFDLVTDSAADQVCAVLDEHTREEFGVRYRDGQVNRYHKKEEAAVVGSMNGRSFVSRRVTAWEPVEGETT